MIPIPAFTISPRLLLGAAVAVSIFYGGWAARAHLAKGEIASLKLAHAEAVAAAGKKLRDAQDEARKREIALTEQAQGIVNEARSVLQGLERQIGASDAASRGLLDSAARAAGRCSASANPAPTGGGAGPTMSGGRTDGDRLLRVLGELDGFAGAAAEDSGRARAARAACQAAYEAAMKAVNQ